jgi:hypothetical protein
MTTKELLADFSRATQAALDAQECDRILEEAEAAVAAKSELSAALSWEAADDDVRVELGDGGVGSGTSGTADVGSVGLGSLGDNRGGHVDPVGNTAARGEGGCAGDESNGFAARSEDKAGAADGAGEPNGVVRGELDVEAADAFDDADDADELAAFDGMLAQLGVGLRTLRRADLLNLANVGLGATEVPVPPPRPTAFPNGLMTPSSSFESARGVDLGHIPRGEPPAVGGRSGPGVSDRTFLGLPSAATVAHGSAARKAPSTLHRPFLQVPVAAPRMGTDLGKAESTTASRPLLDKLIPPVPKMVR